MSWAQLLASGSGQVNFRLQIEGFPYEAVTSRAMEVTSTDGRIRYAGLDSSRFSLAERVDLVLAHWEPEGFRVQLVDRNRQWTEAFRIPTAVTYMDAIMTSAAGIATVKATGAFASAGQIYTDTETINYAALNTAGTAFQSVVRGKWESLAQTHYTVDGERARRPEVTNWPRVREGRRVALYAYGAGDALADTSPTAGTKIWTGVVSTEPQFDGMSWSFSIDPITRKWDADVGGDLEDPTDIRGIYYPAQSPLVVKVVEHADIGRNSAVQASTIFMMAGFWETQRDFLIALNAQLDSAAQLSTPLEGTFTQEVEAVERGDTWALQYTTASTPDEKFMSLYATSAVDRIWMASGVWQNYEVSSGFSGNSVGPDNRYEQRQVSSDFGRVPRAAIGRGPGVDWGGWTIGTRAVDISDVTFPSTRVYIGGITAVTATTAAAAFEWESNGNPNPDEGLGESFSCDVIVVNTANRYIELDNVRPLRSVGGGNRHYSASGSGIVSIRLGRKYGAGHLGDFITALTADVPDFLNTGAVPDVRASDFVSTGGGISIASTGIPGAAAGNPLANNRGYTVFSPVSFAEMVEHECRLLGVFPAYNANGEVTFHRVRLPTAGEVVAKTITAADIITGDGEWLSYEVAPLGMFSTVELSTGYDPVEDEYNGRKQIVRDIEAFGRNPNSRTLTIEPKSTDRGIGFSYNDVVKQLGGILGTWGGSYAYLTIRVKFSLFSLLIGDVVKITWNKVPNPDGTLGVTNKIAFVVGREWEFNEASGKITLLVTDQNIAGYVSSATITVTDGATGSTGPFTATADDDYFPGSTSAEDHWTAGDLIRLFGYDTTATTNNALGTIVAVNGDTIVFSTTANWTHDGGESWVLGSRVSTAILAATQKIYNYIANDDATVDFSGSTGNSPFTLAT